MLKDAPSELAFVFYTPGYVWPEKEGAWQSIPNVCSQDICVSPQVNFSLVRGESSQDSRHCLEIANIWSCTLCDHLGQKLSNSRQFTACNRANCITWWCSMRISCQKITFCFTEAINEPSKQVVMKPACKQVWLTTNISMKIPIFTYFYKTVTHCMPLKCICDTTRHGFYTQWCSDLQKLDPSSLPAAVLRGVRLEKLLTARLWPRCLRLQAVRHFESMLCLIRYQSDSLMPNLWNKWPVKTWEKLNVIICTV